MKQIKISITCDEGFVADALREIANTYENRPDDEPEAEFETAHYMAEITEEEE